MIKFNLDSNESVLIQRTGVLLETGGLSLKPYSDEVILTNKNFVWINKGVFGKTKGIRKFPLDQLKIVNGEVQAFVGKGSTGIANLELYFINENRVFQFQNSSKREIAKWVNEISQVLTGRNSTRNSVFYQPAIPGTEYVTETFKNAVGLLKNTIGLNSKDTSGVASEKLTKKCLGCKAPLTGTLEQTITCRYCDTVQILKQME